MQRLANTHSLNARGYKGLFICLTRALKKCLTLFPVPHSLTLLRPALLAQLFTRPTCEEENPWRVAPVQNSLSNCCHTQLSWWWDRDFLHGPMGLQQRPIGVTLMFLFGAWVSSIACRKGKELLPIHASFI